MYFVISFFIAFCCFATLVLFVDIFPKWAKLFFGLLGTASMALAGCKLYDKIAGLTHWYKTDYQLLPDFYYALGICAFLVIIWAFFASRHHKALLKRREEGIMTDKEKRKEEKKIARMKKEDEEDEAFRKHEKEVEEKRAKRRAEKINRKLEKKAKKKENKKETESNKDSKEDKQEKED